MSVLILKIEFDGTNYSGWQIQANSITVQEKIENALKAITGSEIKVIGAGRTDAGAHASGMIAHADTFGHLDIPEDNLPKAINAKLPADIIIKQAKLTGKHFHARFDAVAREYSYSLHQRQSVFLNRFSAFIPYILDRKILMRSASIFIGKHNFTAYSKFNPDTKNYICDVKLCEWTENGVGSYKLKIIADRFVYGMVRMLTGAMIDAARGKKSIEDLENYLKMAERKDNSTIAPPQGLTLEKIYYPKNLEFFKGSSKN